MNKTRLPLLLGVAGIAIGYACMAWWWYAHTANPFHLPSLEEAAALANYSAPPMYFFMNWLIWILVPCLWLYPSKEIGGWAYFAFWFFAALLNGPIYYGAALATSSIWGALARDAKKKAIKKETRVTHGA